MENEIFGEVVSRNCTECPDPAEALGLFSVTMLCGDSDDCKESCVSAEEKEAQTITIVVVVAVVLLLILGGGKAKKAKKSKK